jgi:hypothetical protein
MRMDWIIFFKLLLSSYLCTPLILLTYEIINDEFLPRRKKKKRHPQLEDIPQPKPFTIHTRQIMNLPSPRSEAVPKKLPVPLKAIRDMEKASSTTLGDWQSRIRPWILEQEPSINSVSVNHLNSLLLELARATAALRSTVEPSTPETGEASPQPSDTPSTRSSSDSTAPDDTLPADRKA